MIPGCRLHPVYRDRPAGRKGHVWRDAAALDYYAGELVIAWVGKHGRAALVPRAPDMTLLDAQLRAARAELAKLDEAAKAERITATQAITWAAPLNRQVADITARIRAATAASVDAHMFTTDDIRAGWNAAPLEARRSLIRALMTITILPSPRGRPAGHKKGEGYFRTETVRIEWKRGEG